MRIAVVAGTRPEAIKLAPVTRLLGPEAVVICTGQHYSAGMSGHIKPDVVLGIRHDPGLTRGRQLGQLISALDHVLGRQRHDAVLVQGDTTSALAGALAASAAGTPLVHLEAGLRSYDRAMPEEHHRVLIDHLADLCCAPTPRARDNLLAERIAPERIEITGVTQPVRLSRWQPPRTGASGDRRRRGSGSLRPDLARAAVADQDEYECGTAIPSNCGDFFVVILCGGPGTYWCPARCGGRRGLPVLPA